MASPNPVRSVKLTLVLPFRFRLWATLAILSIPLAVLLGLAAVSQGRLGLWVGVALIVPCALAGALASTMDGEGSYG